MNRPKKEIALEVAIEQELLKRGESDVRQEFLNEISNPVKRNSIYINTRLKLILKWSKQKTLG